MGSHRGEAVLDGLRLRDREEAMAYLAEALSLPEWWGRNLDALYDCLTDLGPFRLTVENREAMEGTEFGRRLLAVFRDAEAENPLLDIKYKL